jgi:ParB family chromosome partitioning protein
MEKALFAKKLLNMGQSKETIKSALSIDDTLLSRMLSVAETVPPAVIDAIGAAKTVGRDRWEELKKLVSYPKNANFAEQVVQSDEFQSTESAGRFNYLLAQLKLLRKAARKPAEAGESGAWAPEDKMVAVSYRNTGKTFSLSLKSKEAGEFGQFISSSLEALYRAFKGAKVRNEPGD